VRVGERLARIKKRVGGITSRTDPWEDSGESVKEEVQRQANAIVG